MVVDVDFGGLLMDIRRLNEPAWKRLNTSHTVWQGLREDYLARVDVYCPKHMSIPQDSGIGMGVMFSKS